MSNIPDIESISIISKQDVHHKIANNLEEVKSLDEFDYFVISSETHLHQQHLSYLNQNCSNKLIFCEKPLFHKLLKFQDLKNTVGIGYLLRFHPLIQKLKENISNKHVITSNFYCGQYLPTWRKGRHYTKGYSANKNKGGGVLLDLSHELDLIHWLLGPIESQVSISGKFSDLDIDSDDLLHMIAKTKHHNIINLSLDYISKFPKRNILMHTHEMSIDLDLIQDSLNIYDLSGKLIESHSNKVDRNEVFTNMHLDFLNDRKVTSTYDDAFQIMELIDTIKKAQT